MRARTFSALLLSFLPCLLLASGLVQNGTMETDENGDGVADGWAIDIHQGATGSADLVASDRAGSRCQHVVHANASKEWVRVSQEKLPATAGHLYAMSAKVRARGQWLILLYEFSGGTYKTHRIA
ncbi:MAG: hypothetical protein HN380_28290, partial [Victivallales bacterium]|nr:hypothetical protein [Victivallales bacterium]